MTPNNFEVVFYAEVLGQHDYVCGIWSAKEYTITVGGQSYGLWSLKGLKELSGLKYYIVYES